MVSRVEKDLDHISENKFVEVSGKKFYGPSSYLGHILSNESHGHYLIGSKIESKFAKFNSGFKLNRWRINNGFDDHKSKSDSKDNGKDHEKDHGMGM